MGNRQFVAGFRYGLEGIRGGGTRRFRASPHLCYRNAEAAGESRRMPCLFVTLSMWKLWHNPALDRRSHMSRLIPIALCAAVLWGSIASAAAGHIWHNTRAWAVAGPGGFYGLVESEGVGVGVGTPSRRETAVCLGPKSVSVPLAAPFVLVLAIVISGAARSAVSFGDLGEGRNAGSIETGVQPRPAHKLRDNAKLSHRWLLARNR